jgi:hypothetical protein
MNGDRSTDWCDRMAIAAAPYLHPRLAAVDHSGKVGWLTHEEALPELE